MEISKERLKILTSVKGETGQIVNLRDTAAGKHVQIYLE
jgi:hypothetical protein